MATYWENSCSFGLRYVSWYKYLIVSLVFPHLGFWSGILFLIALFLIFAYLYLFTARLEFRKHKYSRPLISIDYLKQIHISFNAVTGSHFYGKPIYCLFKKADICYTILNILFNKYDIYFNSLDIYYKEDILYSKYDIHLINLDIQNVNIRYSQC